MSIGSTQPCYLAKWLTYLSILYGFHAKEPKNKGRIRALISALHDASLNVCYAGSAVLGEIWIFNVAYAKYARSSEIFIVNACQHIFLFTAPFNFFIFQHRRKRFRSLLKQLKSLEEHILFTERDYSHYYALSAWAFAFILVKYAAFISVYPIESVSWMDYVGLSFNEAARTLPMLQFAAWSIFVGRAFERASIRFFDMRPLDYIRPENKPVAMLGYIRVAKNALKLQRRVCDIYGSMLISSVWAYTSQFIIAACVSFSRNPYSIALSNTPFYFKVTEIIGLLLAVILFSCCEYSVDKLNKCVRSIHKQMGKESLVLRKQLMNFSTSFLHRDLTFQACGILHFTYKQLFSISLFIVSYLLVQIQYEIDRTPKHVEK